MAGGQDLRLSSVMALDDPTCKVGMWGTQDSTEDATCGTPQDGRRRRAEKWRKGNGRKLEGKHKM